MNETDHKAMRDKTEALINLNKIEVFLGVVVACIAVLSALGAWYILPYRLDRAEEGLAELRAELQTVKRNSEETRELLVRIDERLKLIQQNLKIPSNP